MWFRALCMNHAIAQEDYFPFAGEVQGNLPALAYRLTETSVPEHRVSAVIWRIAEGNLQLVRPSANERYVSATDQGKFEFQVTARIHPGKLRQLRVTESERLEG